MSEKKKLMEKIKEKENRIKKKQEELQKTLQDEVDIYISILYISALLQLNSYRVSFHGSRKSSSARRNSSLKS